MSPDVVIYVKGGCTPKKVGGWSLLIIHANNGDSLSVRKGVVRTSKHKMVLQASIEALSRIEPGPTIEIRTDSWYLYTMRTDWVDAWREKNWTKKRGANNNKKIRPISNLNLVRDLDALCLKHRVTFVRVKDDSGIPYVEKLLAAAIEAVNKDYSLKTITEAYRVEE